MNTNRNSLCWVAGAFIFLLVAQLLATVPAQEKKVSVESLIYDLKHPEAERRKKAATLLGKNQIRSAVPALVEAAGDSDSGVRLEVVRALNSIRDVRAVPAYAKLTSDSTLQIQKEAVKGIESVYVLRETGFMQGVKKVADLVNPFSDDFDAVVVEPYVKVDPAAIDSLASLLSADDAGLRASAASALGTLRARSALPAIESRVGVEEDENVSVELVWAIIKIGERESAKSLIPLTRSASTKVRGQVIYGLGRMKATEAVPELTELYSAGIEERKKVLGIPVSSADEFQKNVYQSLAYIGDARNKDLFVEGLKSEGDFYRRFGAEGIGRIGDTSMTTDLGRSYISEKSGKARLAVGYALYLLGREEHLDEVVASVASGQAKHYLLEFEEADVPKLYGYVDSSKPAVQVALLEVIGLRGGSDAMEVVEKAASSPNADVASAGNLAIRRLRGRHP
jgi:HEAT repeat protein